MSIKEKCAIFLNKFYENQWNQCLFYSHQSSVSAVNMSVSWMKMEIKTCYNQNVKTCVSLNPVYLIILKDKYRQCNIECQPR